MTERKGYKKLKAYEQAHRLVMDVYAVTATFPKSELFGLISQMRRAAVSVVANIIEGQARASKNEFRHFLSVANGSLVEVEYYLELARDLQYISAAEYEKLEQQRHQTGLLVGGLRKYLANKS